MFSACLRLSTPISKLPFLIFFTVFRLALVDITFSMRKDENLTTQTSSKDSITMNLGKSATSISESDSERFRLDFLFEDAIYAVYFSLALRSTTYHGVQLVLGMNQGGNPFVLVETGIRDQYTRVEGRHPSRGQFQVLNTGQIPIQPPSDQVRDKVECCKSLTSLLPDQWLLNHQGSVLTPYGSPPTANRWPL